MPASYIRIIYAKGKIFLLVTLTLLIIFAAFHKVTTALIPILTVEEEVTPAVSKPNPKFSPQEEEKKIAEVQALPTEEVRRELLEMAPPELKTLIEQGQISDEMLRELLIVMSKDE